MNRNELIAAVALDLIKQLVKQEREGSLRFCMIGLECSLVCSIAEAVLSDSEMSATVAVRISPAFDPDSGLPEEAKSNQSITHWRHCRLPEGKRAVLLAVPQQELQRNNKSIEKITKIETDTLRGRYEAWVDKVDLAPHLEETERTQLIAGLKSANTTHVARTIETFTDFVLAISDGIISKGFPIPKAIDNALPSLRLPQHAGFFNSIPEEKRDVSSEWNKVFRRLHKKIRPLLVREDPQGEPIPQETLRKNFREIQDGLEDSERRTIQAFLDADLRHSNWAESQKALVELDWRKISGLFENIKKSPLGLGRRTIEFLEEEFGDPLNNNERELLTDPLPKNPADKHREFFQSYREHLAHDKKLLSSWEKYLYGSYQTYKDFLVGLLATTDRLLRRCTGDNELTEKKLRVSIPNAQAKNFWKGKNPHVARYFAFRYRGLGTLLQGNVELDFGKLEEFYFPQTDRELKKVSSKSKVARSIKFEVALEVVLEPKAKNEKIIFNWEMPVEAIATAFPDDLIRVANHKEKYALLPTANITRQSVSGKGSIQRLDLRNVNTIRDVSNTNKGRLVAPNEESGDQSQAFRTALKELSGKEIISQEGKAEIGGAFDAFLISYTEAIRAWSMPKGAGITCDAFIAQADAYGKLLKSLLKHANKDLAREKLWCKILCLGVANISAGTPAAIITPWHPLRLGEISIKARQIAKLLHHVLHANGDDIFEADLFFRQAQLELESNYYPEICVGFHKEKPILLTEADTSCDYTLAEPPLLIARPDGDDTLDIDPSVAAKKFSSVGEQYLKLLPHERNNFSVVLYNTESKDLPGELASKLTSKVEQGDELQCDLLLTHSDLTKLNRIYEQQNATVNDESGSPMASQATRNFLSRMRIGILNPGDIPNEESDESYRDFDLVFLQDVAAQNADLVWKKAPGDGHPELIGHVPARWSRRLPVDPGDTTTAVYLTCPKQPYAGQAYLNAIQFFLKSDSSLQENVIPARQVNVRNGDIGDILRRAHQIGEWVVNFDELVDRRLLENIDVQTLRYIKDRDINHNLVVSTKSKPRLLHHLLEKWVKHFNLNITGDDAQVTNNLINQANALSGQVIMRATRYGPHADDLLGIILSMGKIRSILGGENLPLGWYFLDDCASWFGRPEEQIADLMAIAPRIENGSPVLKVAISEAKFISSKEYRAQAKRSAKQLIETVACIGRALDPKHQRIDRHIWLHHLGNFMIDGMKPFDSEKLNNWDLHKWSEKVRADKVPIQLLGFSHVFVHDDKDYVDTGGSSQLKGMPYCVQQVFDRASVAAALRSFVSDRPSDQISSSDPSTSEKKDWAHALISLATEPRFETTAARSMAIKESPPIYPRAETVSNDNTKADPVERTTEINEKIEAEQVEVAMKATRVPTSLGEVGLSESRTERDAQSGERSCEKWPSHDLAAWVSAGGQASSKEDDKTKEWLDQTVMKLRSALRRYDMAAELTNKRLTPNAALVHLRGSDDLTVSKLKKRQQELLTSYAINIIDVQPAPMEVVITIARPERTILHLRDLWRQRELPPSAPNLNTSLLLGMRESDGKFLYLNVGEKFGGEDSHGPHTLIAGETGSGKGILAQCLLLDICATNAPTQARIKMIDPKKGIDFPWLRQMPHLDDNLITEPGAAIEAFKMLVAEMERRNHLLAEAGVNKLSHYNQKVDPSKILPRIWLFHDELADWMMDREYRDAVELSVNRLGIKARAIGINLVLILQRPDKDVLPLQLRANLSNRLVLKVADKKNSVLVLDEAGAELLLGQGHLAAKLTGGNKIIYAQVPFIDEEEIKKVAELIARAWQK